LNRKHLGTHSRKSSTSAEDKLPKIVKSSSSTENPMLETLYSPNKSSLKVIKSHEDSENSCSPDLSPGIERLFNAMNLCENSKSLIISINLCNIKNMIHLSNLELDELSSLFSRKD
jgi:hypothetical protein